MKNEANEEGTVLEEIAIEELEGAVASGMLLGD